MRNFLLLLLVLAGGLACQRSNRPPADQLPVFEEQTAELVLQVVSRGVYEYLIAVADQEYLPRTLSESLRERCRNEQGRLPVVISGKVLSEKAWVHRPGPTDAPERDREVHWIELSRIEAR